MSTQKYISWHGIVYEVTDENMKFIIKDWEERTKKRNEELK